MVISSNTQLNFTNETYFNLLILSSASWTLVFVGKITKPMYYSNDPPIHSNYIQFSSNLKRICIFV